jgi:hypothetical protein
LLFERLVLIGSILVIMAPGLCWLVAWLNGSQTAIAAQQRG